VSHPSLGLPPDDPTAGDPAAAARIRSDVERLAGRALRVAMDADPSIERRHDEAGLRQLLLDAELLAERVALSVAAGRPDLMREYAEWTAIVYRRRKTSMDDVVRLCEGLRAALAAVLTPAEQPAAGAVLDEAIAVYRWHRRIAGDARKRNALLQLIYKGG
jgi:hypothetical protein